MPTQWGEMDRLLREIEALRSRVLSLEAGGALPEPSGAPAQEPSGAPAREPSGAPAREPSGAPARELSGAPAREPSGAPAPEPTERASRALLNATAESAALIDIDGIVVDANDNMAASLGITRERLIGSPILQYFSPEIAAARRAKAEQAAGEKRLVRFIDSRDGRWIEISICPVLDSDGNPFQLAIFSRDITNYIEAELALKRERDRAKSYLDLADVILLALDRDGRIQMINRKGCAILGHPRDFLAGKNFFDTCAPAPDRAGMQSLFRRIVEEDVPFREHYETELETSGGEIRLVDWQYTLLRDPDGRVTGTLSSGTDITEKKKAEEALRESEHYYKTLFEAASDGIFIMEGYRFIDCNQQALRMFDCPRGKLLGITPADVSPPLQPDGQDSKEKSLKVMDAVRAGILQIFEWRHRRGDGTPFDAEIHLAPLNVSGPSRFVAIVRDISKRKKAEEALNRALDEVRRIKEAVEAENVYLTREIRMSHLHGDIVGQSDAIQSVLALAEQVAGTDSTVLLLGETGTGKELLARAIHNMSPRKNRPLVVVNCAAIPGPLVESELFGREKGAFTGAISRQIGRFEIADGSTIFLDEIGELSQDIQAKLLRVLQEGQIERLGGTRTIDVDVRVIAATNRDLKAALKDHTFRKDLFYRLNVFPISLPPLRDRRGDIPSLVWHFVDEIGERMGKRIDKIPQQSIDTLTNHAWPGNIRELHNVIERAMIQAKDTTLRIPPLDPASQPGAAPRTMVEVERQHIVDVLAQTGWRVRGKHGAAEILDIKPTTLESRMQRLGIRRSRENAR